MAHLNFQANLKYPSISLSTPRSKQELVKNLSERYRMLTHSVRACFSLFDRVLLCYMFLCAEIFAKLLLRDTKNDNKEKKGEFVCRSYKNLQYFSPMVVVQYYELMTRAYLHKKRKYCKNMLYCFFVLYLQ